MQLPLKQKLFYFFPTLFCFCLPFGSLILSGIIVLWFVTSLFNINKFDLKKGLKNKTVLFLFLFFLVTLISALFSADKTSAVFEVESKLSFVFLPYLLFCFTIPIQIIKRCIVSFVSGCFFACLFLVARACIYAFNGHPEYFFYTQFSILIHASYFSMYLILAVVLVILFYKKWFQNQKSTVYSSYFFVLLFGATIFLCASKLGLISFVIILPILLMYKLKSILNFKKSIILIIGLSVIIIFSVKLFPTAFERLQSLRALNINQLNKTSSESTTVRFLIWQQALDLIKHNFLTGVGVGNTNDALYTAYQQNGLTGAFEHKLNAHNQFLQTFIGLGIIGFISLFLITFWQAINAVLQKQFLLFIFLLLIILNFLVESMLQTATGTLFFVFFYCLFNVTKKKQLLDE